MQYILNFFDYISNLGSYVMIPVMITIVGLIVGLKFKDALKSGMTVGIGLIGLNLALTLIWDNISPVANLFVEKFNLNLTTIDTGWGAAAGLAFSTPIGSFIIPFIILVNIILLTIRYTRTVNIDIWNYWHYAFSGAVIYALTNNLFLGFVAAAIHCALALKIADVTAEDVQEALKIPGVSIPQGFAVSTVYILKPLDKFYDWIASKFKKNETEVTEKKEKEISSKLDFFKEPIFIGAIIGIILSVSVGYNLQQVLNLAMMMAALVYILPRMTRIIMEGLVPISDKTRDFMGKKYQNEEVYIGMDSAILLGLPTTVSVGILLIPIVLILAMILPGNTTLPLGDLAATAFLISMATVIHKGDFWKTLVSGVVITSIVLVLASFFAPIITEFAKSGAQGIPEGAIQVTALSAGNLFSYIMYRLAQLGFITLPLVLVLILVLHFVFYFKNKNKNNVKEKSY